jgi:hypothetical protein
MGGPPAGHHCCLISRIYPAIQTARKGSNRYFSRNRLENLSTLASIGEAYDDRGVESESDILADG